MTEPLPALVPLKLYRGDTRTWEDTFTYAPLPGATVGQPFDLTGYGFLAQIRGGAESAVVMAVIDVEVLDAPAGRIRRTLSAIEARKLLIGTGYWDLQLTRPDGSVRTYMAGKVKIMGDSSRA
jgi:hypothetical protein